MIYMNSTAICIHIWMNSLSLVNFSSLVKNLKITGISVINIWLVQGAIDCLSRIETFWNDNIPGVEHELVATGHLDHLCSVLKTLWVVLYHLCWVSKTWCVGLGRLGLGCLIGDFRKFIFFDIIAADNMVPLYGIKRARHCLRLRGNLWNLKWCTCRKEHSFNYLNYRRESP